MSDCYEKRSVIVTTNIEFSRWGTVFGDDKLAAAIIDRLVHPAGSWSSTAPVRGWTPRSC